MPLDMLLIYFSYIFSTISIKYTFWNNRNKLIQFQRCPKLISWCSWIFMKLTSLIFIPTLQTMKSIISNGFNFLTAFNTLKYTTWIIFKIIKRYHKTHIWQSIVLLSVRYIKIFICHYNPYNHKHSPRISKALKRPF